MRQEPNVRIEQYRVVHPTLGGSEPGANWGYFERGPLRIISSGFAEGNPAAKGWEHVSVSCIDRKNGLPYNRNPTWNEMAEVKEMFWEDEETVIQFHPRRSAYINEMEFCLHLWKMAETEYILPPRNLIGSK